MLSTAVWPHASQTHLQNVDWPTVNEILEREREREREREEREREWERERERERVSIHIQVPVHTHTLRTGYELH